MKEECASESARHIKTSEGEENQQHSHNRKSSSNILLSSGRSSEPSVSLGTDRDDDNVDSLVSTPSARRKDKSGSLGAEKINKGAFELVPCDRLDTKASGVKPQGDQGQLEMHNRDR